MKEKLKPCKCGHEGELSGTDCGFFYKLKCPQCGAQVEAFTMDGLVEAWNKQEPTTTGEGGE